MPARGQWVFDPDSGGKMIPETVKRDIEKRIHAIANEQFKGRYKHLDIRFRGQFCYIDAYTEPRISENWPPPNWPERMSLSPISKKATTSKSAKAAISFP